jgi:hypothetical protein
MNSHIRLNSFSLVAVSKRKLSELMVFLSTVRAVLFLLPRFLHGHPNAMYFKNCSQLQPGFKPFFFPFGAFSFPFVGHKPASYFLMPLSLSTSAFFSFYYRIKPVSDVFALISTSSTPSVFPVFNFCFPKLV